jgi:hypothetical protein
MLTVLVALSLGGARVALADDGGDAMAGAEGGPGATADTADDDGAAPAADAAPQTTTVIACDGGLCDTVQGRPTCSAAGPIGAAPLASGCVGAVIVAVGLALGRRARRGTSGPTSRGDA